MDLQYKIFLISLFLVTVVFGILMLASVLHYAHMQKRTNKEQAIRDARAKEIKETRQEK
ncbi:MAG: hypothetical protein H7A25_11150 [Leptospiraceae bacterium]|nr:hypothetical protein [Leptospiraceae bacterium]